MTLNFEQITKAMAEEKFKLISEEVNYSINFQLFENLDNQLYSPSSNTLIKISKGIEKDFW